MREVVEPRNRKCVLVEIKFRVCRAQRLIEKDVRINLAEEILKKSFTYINKRKERVKHACLYISIDKRCIRQITVTGKICEKEMMYDGAADSRAHNESAATNKRTK